MFETSFIPFLINLLASWTEKPNSFVTFHVENPFLVSNVEKIQQNLTNLDPRFNSSKFQSLTSLHVTINIFDVNDQNLDSAKQALFEAASRFQTIYKEKPIVFDHLDQFQNSTLYATPDFDSTIILKILEQTVTSAFKNRGIRGLNQYKYHPHLTIAELKNPDAELAQKWRNLIGKELIGSEIIKSLQLCRMKLGNKKYYDILAESFLV